MIFSHKNLLPEVTPKLRHYREYGNYDNIFRDSLFSESSKLNIEVADLNKSITVCINTLIMLQVRKSSLGATIYHS